MKLTSNARFGNEAMPAATETPQPAAAPQPELPASSMPQMPADQVSFSGSPKFGADLHTVTQTVQETAKIVNETAKQIDLKSAEGIKNFLELLSEGGIKNPLNWVAVSTVGLAAQDGFRTINKLLVENPLKESIAKSLAQIARTANAIAPQAPVETAETIIKEVVKTTK